MIKLYDTCGEYVRSAAKLEDTPAADYKLWPLWPLKVKFTWPSRKRTFFLRFSPTLILSKVL